MLSRTIIASTIRSVTVVTANTDLTSSDITSVSLSDDLKRSRSVSSSLLQLAGRALRLKEFSPRALRSYSQILIEERRPLVVHGRGPSR